MTTEQISVHVLKEYIKEQLTRPGTGTLDKAWLKSFLNNLGNLETELQVDQADDPATEDWRKSRVLNRERLIESILDTRFRERTSMVSMKEVRHQLERCFDMGVLAGIAQERYLTYQVVLILEGGVVKEGWTARPKIELHVIDLDRDAADPVHHHVENPEYTTLLKPSEMVKRLETEYS